MANVVNPAPKLSLQLGFRLATERKWNQEIIPQENRLLSLCSESDKLFVDPVEKPEWIGPKFSQRGGEILDTPYFLCPRSD